MRWTSSKIGAIRNIRKFLIFPREINNEYRWFEWVYIEQIYMVHHYYIDGIRYHSNIWRDVNWLSKWEYMSG